MDSREVFLHIAMCFGLELLFFCLLASPLPFLGFVQYIPKIMHAQENSVCVRKPGNFLRLIAGHLCLSSETARTSLQLHA